MVILASHSFISLSLNLGKLRTFNVNYIKCFDYGLIFVGKVILRTCVKL